MATNYAIGKASYEGGKRTVKITATVSKEEWLSYMTIRALQGYAMMVEAVDDTLVLED